MTSRKPPKIQPPDLTLSIKTKRIGDKNVEIEIQERKYKLITPLFGGGVEAGKADPVTVIRGASIRGQLRFWWRAIRGGNFDGNLSKMKEIEDELWGAPSTPDKASPSRVQIGVIINSKGTQDYPFEVRQFRSRAKEGSLAPAYAAFPLQPSEDEAKNLERTRELPKSVIAGIEFTLKVTFPTGCRKEVEATLWAWETFGGIGARTRRGFGALRLTEKLVDGVKENLDLPPSTKDVKKWLEGKFSNFVEKKNWHQDVPHLPEVATFKFTPAYKREKNRKTGQENKTLDTNQIAENVWKYLVDQLKRFRQSRYDKERGKDFDNDYGPSRWPEADEIRRILDQDAQSEGKPIIVKFPRAAMGLPIVFHLAHDEDLNKPTIELRGTKYNRRSSPLILRPLECADGKAIGLAFVMLPSSLPPDDSLRLVIEKPKYLKADMSLAKIDTLLTKADAIKIKPLHWEQDILKAFLETLKN